jgi:hypothetical protein
MHPLLGKASHVLWEPCDSPVRAFYLEWIWFHRLTGAAGVVNMIHPARPASAVWTCPVCDTYQYEIALKPRSAPKQRECATSQDCLTV